jgi:CopA family copper-resistance protein
VHYDLFITDSMVNYTGKIRPAIAINGQIPGPILSFTEGDTAEIFVHNLLKTGTSIHWHGVFLPNQYDGVPYLTQMPIPPQKIHMYKFPVIQNGTYWYHSHSELQEQSGMYGALIFNKRKTPMKELAAGENVRYRKGIDDKISLPIVLSDWTNKNPKEVDRLLHTGSDWFGIKKGSTQSYSEAILSGNFFTKLKNEWKRMTAMDVSDIHYDRFLINGKTENQLPQFKAGDKVRLQLINAAASSYFWLTWGSGKFMVVANDGNDIEPVEVDRLLIAVAETYDIIVTIPENMSYELCATSEDRIANASLWLGSGMKMPAAHLKKLKYFEGMKMMNAMMKMNGDLDLNSMGEMIMSNQTMDMNEVMYPEISGEEQATKENSNHQMHEHQMSGTEMNEGDQMNSEIVTLNYSMLKATEKTKLPNDSTRVLKFTLTGNMHRFVWSLDNKTVSETDKILIHKGENIRLIIFNNSMMRHPMHLHGHDFRLLNAQGDYAPLKNVLDLMPMEIDTIEFSPVEKTGDWFFHCHILYHMMSGMGRIFSYDNSPPNPEIPNPKTAQQKLFDEDRHFHFMAKAGVESNGLDGEFMFNNTRWKIEEMWHFGYHDEHGYESETSIGRYFGKMQWLLLYAGFDYHNKKEGEVSKGFFDHEGSPKNIFGNDSTNLFGQYNNKNNRHSLTIGLEYLLPLLISADFRIDLDGKLRIQLSREGIPISPRLRMSWMLNTDREYMLGFRYITSTYISVSSHYDSDMGFGLGLTLTY